MAVPFKQVDVFTTTPFKGNPVAVVMDARGLSTEQMQAIARWTNLSETTFVLPATNPAADYQVRIFTPGSELPFAGHPTIGTAYALIEAGVIAPKNGCLTQECGAGLVALTVEPTADGNLSISFELPEPAITPLIEAQTQALESILGCAIDKDFTPALVDVGARWIVAQVKDAQSVLSAMPNYEALQEHDRNLGSPVFVSMAGTLRILMRTLKCVHLRRLVVSTKILSVAVVTAALPRLCVITQFASQKSRLSVLHRGKYWVEREN